MEITLREQDFILLPEKALYKPNEGLLIIADIHLGKASHFRKAGISIPSVAQSADYENLKNLFYSINPQKVYFLGDLFHSSFNGDWNYFTELIVQYQQIEFTLIKGNHDLINKKLFDAIGIKVIDEVLEDENFIYSHAPLKDTKGKLNIAGHIHPGIRLSGLGRQSLTIPCYYLTDTLFLLPAFGILTGLYIMDQAVADVFVVLSNEVKKI
jgi:DNA ligase-associated metallophosphoesterase